MKYLSAACCGLAFVLSALTVSAQAPVVKVDLNIAERRPAEVNELNYLPWAVKSGSETDALKANGITFTFTKKGGDKLSSNYYKTAVQAPYYARLAGDGLMLTGNGAALELRITGLPSGKHTLLTYHNSLTGGANAKVSPISISVDGKQQVNALVPSQRVKDNTESESAYLQLNAVKGKDVVILFQADAAPGSTTQVIVNGFELNTPDIHDVALRPQPASGDEHADADGHNLTLKWTAAKKATSHDVYFGTDSATIANANTSAAAYKGNFRTAEYKATSLYSLLTYFWRVDEVTADGRKTKGAVWYFRPRQLAFTGAEGYGRFARGGRGGRVVEVTNLNDDGPGSFREAVMKNIGPRTIVFAVSGLIRLKSRLTLQQRYITIAGQTAPGKGICFAGAPVGIVNDDNVVRFIRVRLGAGPTYDGMGLTGANNSIVDHCSISWTIDEGFSSRGAHNITLQRTIIAEALNIAGHTKYGAGKSHGFAASIGGEVGSFHHNLLAHNAGRNWSLAGGADGDGNYLGKMDLRNNVVYNWDHRTTDGGARQVNFVGNYYKPGAATTFFWALNAQHEGYGGGMQQYYFAGNVMPGKFDLKNQEDGRKETGKVSYQTFLDKPFFESYVTTQTAEEAYKDVLSDVGCNQPLFDDHDIRIVNETLEGKYTYKGSKSGKPGLPDTQEDVGGWENYPELQRAASFDTDHDGLPDWWEKLHGTNPKSAVGDFSDSNADTDRNGETNLDKYLNWMANIHYSIAVGKPMNINLKQFARGYTGKCTYQLSNVTNGKFNNNGDGTVTFSPLQKGLASFSFTVTDASGSKFTRKVNITTEAF